MKFRYSPLILSMLCQHTLAQDLLLEEVIVTAQKRQQSTQDIPISISPVQGKTVQDYAVLDFKDVEQLTAGLTLKAGRRDATISMRGISFDPASGARAVVDTYWNGIPAQPNVIFQQMYDVERLEVLRGPQGTLQGRTSPGGAISMVTKKPSLEEIEGRIQTSVSDESGFNTQFGVSLPLIEGKLAMRVAGVYDESDANQVENVVSGEGSGNLSRAGRVTLLWQPTDEFDATLVLDYHQRDQDQAIPVEGFDLRPTGGPTLDAYDRKSISDDNSILSNDNKLSVLTLNWELDDYTLTSVTSYQDNVQFAYTDSDLANIIPGVMAVQQTATDLNSFTQELRVSVSNNDYWDSVFGLFYSDDKTQTHPSRPASALNPVQSSFDIPVNREELGAFTHNIFTITDQLSAQLGLRWQKVRTFNRSDAELLIPLPTGGVLTQNIALVSDERDSDTSEAVTGALKVQYNINDDWMVYAGFERSFRPGGISIGLGNLAEEHLLYEEETSDAIELGFKTTLLGGQMRFNGAIFHQQFDGYISRRTRINMDANLDGIVDRVPHSGLTTNGDALLRGIELEVQGYAAENWLLGTSLTYTDAKFDSGQSVPCNQFDATGAAFIPVGEQLAYCDVSNQHLSDEPNWSASFNSEYTVSLDSVDWFIRGLYKFTGRRVNEDLGEIGSYGIASLYTGLRSKDDSWEVSLWAKNLFDKQARRGLFAPQITGTPAINYTQVDLEPQQVIGVTASYQFSL